jgi:subtilase family serine protease
MRTHGSAVLEGLLLVGLFLTLLPAATAQNAPRRITEAVDNGQRVALKGNTHPLARHEFDRGVEPDSLRMDHMFLLLTRSPEQETGLGALLAGQHDKLSPRYHRWLTPEQFGERFGPSDADLQIIDSWLTSQGLQVNSNSNGRTLIDFSGNAGLIRSAFRTEIHRFVVNGEEHWANTNDPEIPAALRAVVGGVVGLNNFYLKPMHRVAGIFSRSKTTGSVKPLFTFSGGLCSVFGLPTCYAVGPYDFAAIYNVLPLWNAGIDGTGQTIAVVGKSNINIQDIRDFRALFGIPVSDPVVIIPPGDSDPGLTADETEAVLDIEWSGAVAKNATIKFVTAASSATDGAILSASYVVNTNVAPIMSVSFGECEFGLGASGNHLFSTLWQQAAAQGMTVVVASGDSGSAGCDDDNAQPPAPAVFGLEVSGVSSTPFNVAVGGTDFDDFSNAPNYWNASNSSTTQSSAKSYIPEIPWNQSCTNPRFGSAPESACNSAQLLDRVVTIGGGGGASRCTSSIGADPSTCSGGYPKPSWQAGVGVPNDGKRDVPDVSLFASDGFNASFYIVCEADLTSGNSCNLNSPFTDFIGVGGTSAASPAFAGIMALVNQGAGSAQGNANPVLYSLAAQQSQSACNSSLGPSGSCIFNDVTSGTNAMPCLNPSPNCNVSNSTDLYGILSGFNSTAGYDLATGLGSINARNLVNNWSSAAPVGQFTVSSNPSTLSFASGSSGTATLTVTGTNGFAGAVNFTCGVSPVPVNDPPTCFVFPPSVTLNAATTSGTTTLKVSTTAGLNSGVFPSDGSSRLGYLASSAGVMLLCVFLVAIRHRRSGALASTVAIFALITMAVALSNCAGGGGSNRINLGTPSGGYTVTVTASGGGTARSTNVVLTVQ